MFLLVFACAILYAVCGCRMLLLLNNTLNNAGLIFAQFPDPCSSVCISEPDKSLEYSSGSQSSLGSRSPPKTPVRYLTLPHPYSEQRDGEMMEVLSKHLAHFQKACSSKTGSDILQSSYGDIVLYGVAIEHCARLYRIMVSPSFIVLYHSLSCLTLHFCVACMKNLPGAHALLLGMERIGRRSLIRLMAYIMQSNV